VRDRTFLEDARPQPLVDGTTEHTVRHPLVEEATQHAVVDRVEEGPDVHFEHPSSVRNDLQHHRDRSLEDARSQPPQVRERASACHDLGIAPNTLDRQFDVAAPNIAWVTDIAYLQTWEGWLYLAVSIDLWVSGEVLAEGDEHLRRGTLPRSNRTFHVAHPHVGGLGAHPVHGPERCPQRPRAILAATRDVPTAARARSRCAAHPQASSPPPHAA